VTSSMLSPRQSAPGVFRRLGAKGAGLPLLVALAAAALLPQAAQAHRGWLLPSATVVSGDSAWVTVDAAVSNDLFYFEHQPMRLGGLQVIAPDGSPAAPENQHTGRYRSTFDVKLDQGGTYRIAVLNDGFFASYKLAGETRRLRGSAESLRRELPAQAEAVRVSSNQSRLETFVTVGKPTEGALKPVGRGLELVPATHPNDLFVGDEARFTLHLDGKPAADLKVSVVPGGIRYRDQLNEIQLITDKDGTFSVVWPAPGFYWINASIGDGPDGAQQQAGTIDDPVRRYSYTATVEVLPQ
jgi:uncharacterized GH25 family protein